MGGWVARPVGALGESFFFSLRGRDWGERGGRRGPTLWVASSVWCDTRKVVEGGWMMDGRTHVR